MQYWPLWECTCVHTLIHMLVTGLSILTDVAWWRSFYGNIRNTFNIANTTYGCNKVRTNIVAFNASIIIRITQKSCTPHLVCSCWGVRSHQESWCFRVWNGCSHPEEAVQSESLYVLALGQVVRLRGGRKKKGGR